MTKLAHWETPVKVRGCAATVSWATAIDFSKLPQSQQARMPISE